MNHVIYSDSAEYRHKQREDRIHVAPGARGATAVQLVFAAESHIVDHGKLRTSMAEARALAHRLMEEHDSTNHTGLTRHATLRPITAQQVRELRGDAVQVLDAAELRKMYDVCVSTCYETIKNCPDPQVRLEAAHLLQTMRFIPQSAQ